MPSVRRLLLTSLWIGATLVAACSSDPPAGVLQALDTKPVEGDAKFDQNNVIDPAAFTDIETLDQAAVQKFFHKTPYDRPSFLETYQSNGIRASDAVVSASRLYRINPLVFLVFAEAVQGLIGERNYPFPVDRVEYVFRCGCQQQTSCLPHLAGFDRQVDCLGRALRTAIEEVREKKVTTSGWGLESSSVTLDGLKITPASDVTAALYDRTPRVNEGEPGGTWLFWNLWQVYAKKVDYAGPVGAIDGRWIGEACAVDEACGIEGGLCATDYPDGLCTAACSGKCPTQPSKAEAFCAKFRDGGFCFQICNPNAPQACRPGYKCLNVNGFGKAGETEFVCSPDTTSSTGATTTSTR